MRQRISNTVSTPRQLRSRKKYSMYYATTISIQVIQRPNTIQTSSTGWQKRKHHTRGENLYASLPFCIFLFYPYPGHFLNIPITIPLSPFQDPTSRNPPCAFMLLLSYGTAMYLIDSLGLNTPQHMSLVWCPQEPCSRKQNRPPQPSGIQ